MRFVAGIGMCMLCHHATEGVRICWKTTKNTIYYGHRCVHVVKSQITGESDLIRIYAAKYHITNTIRYNHRYENIVRREARLISQPLSAVMCILSTNTRQFSWKFATQIPRKPPAMPVEKNTKTIHFSAKQYDVLAVLRPRTSPSLTIHFCS